LTQRRLAADSSVGLSTIRRLEGQARPHCHFRTRARLAIALGTHPKALTADSSSHPEGPGVGLPPPRPGEPRTSARVFAARPDQVRMARGLVREVLGDTPVTGDTALISSELATNAILHSASAQPGGSFTVRVELRPGDHAWVEVHDQGGRWVHHPRASGGRGLALVDELATHWDIRGDDNARIICAQLNWPG
jgi:serine/threonine-protein kinase RsbW